MNYRLFLMEPKHVYPQLHAKGTTAEWVVAEWQPKLGESGMWYEIERHHLPGGRVRADGDVRQEIPGGEGEVMSSQPDENAVITVEVTANDIYGASPDDTFD